MSEKHFQFFESQTLQHRALLAGAERLLVTECTES